MKIRRLNFSMSAILKSEIVDIYVGMFHCLRHLLCTALIDLHPHLRLYNGICGLTDPNLSQSITLEHGRDNATQLPRQYNRTLLTGQPRNSFPY